MFLWKQAYGVESSVPITIQQPGFTNVNDAFYVQADLPDHNFLYVAQQFKDPLGKKLSQFQLAWATFIA